VDFRLVLGRVKHVLLARLLAFWQRNLVMSWGRGRPSWRFQVYWKAESLPASICHFLLIFRQLSCPFLRAARWQILLLNTQSCTLVFIALGPGTRICWSLQDLAPGCAAYWKRTKFCARAFAPGNRCCVLLQPPLLPGAQPRRGFKTI